MMTAFVYEKIVFEADWEEDGDGVIINELYHGKDDLLNCFCQDTIGHLESALKDELDRLEAFERWEARK